MNREKVAEAIWTAWVDWARHEINSVDSSLLQPWDRLPSNVKEVGYRMADAAFNVVQSIQHLWVDLNLPFVGQQTICQWCGVNQGEESGGPCPGVTDRGVNKSLSATIAMPEGGARRQVPAIAADLDQVLSRGHALGKWDRTIEDRRMKATCGNCYGVATITFDSAANSLQLDLKPSLTQVEQ